MGIEPTFKRQFNNMQGYDGNLSHVRRCNAVLTDCEWIVRSKRKDRAANGPDPRTPCRIVEIFKLLPQAAKYHSLVDIAIPIVHACAGRTASRGKNDRAATSSESPTGTPEGIGRAQPFHGCSHPSLSSCDPYPYRRSAPFCPELLDP
jgi:hypothetical protein